MRSVDLKFTLSRIREKEITFLIKKRLRFIRRGRFPGISVRVITVRRGIISQRGLCAFSRRGCRFTGSSCFFRTGRIEQLHIGLRHFRAIILFASVRRLFCRSDTFIYRGSLCRRNRSNL